ncbi:MAG: hypothetical protein AAF998_18540 [Bacteroidota bacterium]
MLNFKPIRKFLLWFLGIYAALLVAGHFAGVGDAYRSLVQAMGNQVFQEWWSEGLVDFQPGNDPLQKDMDTVMLLLNREELGQARSSGTNVRVIKVYFSTWQSGFLSTAFILALILASPVPNRRKAVGAGLGLLAITLFVLFRLWVNLMFSWGENPQLGVVEYSSTTSRFIAFLDGIFVKHIVVSLVVPLVLWILIAFRREDWSRLVGSAQST